MPYRENRQIADDTHPGRLPDFERIKSNFQDYTRELLSRDLAKISAAGQRVVNGKRLELMSTAFPDKDGISIRRGGSVRFAGRIAFTEVVT